MPLLRFHHPDRYFGADFLGQCLSVQYLRHHQIPRSRRTNSSTGPVCSQRNRIAGVRKVRRRRLAAAVTNKASAAGK